MTGLTLLKLGGSLITDKQTEFTPRPETLARLAGEIKAALSHDPGLRLVLGHGSGSFGHIPARKYGTRQGVQTPEEWRGFIEVWKAARALNQIVVESLLAAGLPAIALPPSASVLARDGQVEQWELAPLQRALDAGLLPVINGDTIFDSIRGGTILSTEDLFLYLAAKLRPERILLAGLEDGVWEDYPHCTRLISALTPAGYAQLDTRPGASAAVDVTGGMRQKVESMLALVQQDPHLTVAIFSGQRTGLLQQALLGDLPGTIIRSS